MRLPLALTAATAAGLLAVAGTAVPAHATAATGGELRVFSLAPETLRPWDVTDETSRLVVHQLYRGLVDYDLAGRPAPAVAESIESADDIEWVITIRDGFTFHDGTAVDAAAFARGWEAGRAGPHGHLFDRIELVDVVDPDTLLVQLDAPYPGFPSLLGHLAFSPMAETCGFGSDPCPGNGPYQLSTFGPATEIVLERFPDYPDPGQANPDLLRYVIFDDPAEVCGFRAPPLDVVYPFVCEVEVLPPPSLFVETSNELNFLGLPTYLDVFDSQQVRQALSLAIDWEQIIAVADGVRATPADTLVSPHTPGHTPGVCTVCTYAPERARQLLEEAGGFPADELVLWAPAGFGHEEWLALVQENLADLDIDTRLEVDLSLPEYLALAEAQGFTGAFWMPWDPSFPEMDAYLDPLFTSDGRANFTGYANPEVDALIQEGVVEAYQEAEILVLEDLPAIPMWFEEWVAAFDPNTVGHFVWSNFNGPEYGQMSLTG